MSDARVILVTRRFWPLAGGAEVMMGRLAAGLVARGFAVTVLTGKWQSDWPDAFEHHGARVERLTVPVSRRWSTLVYLARLRRWLMAHRDSIDLAYVSGLRHDAYATILAGQRGKFPVLLRAEQAGLAGDCHWQLDAWFGRAIKRRCCQAAAIVVPTPLIEREVIAAGYPRERIKPIALGVPPVSEQSARAQLEARAALAGSERALHLPTHAKLALAVDHSGKRVGLVSLLEAWSIVAASVADAYLWIVGEGPKTAGCEQEIIRLGLVGRVRLAGAFDDIEDFLRAADLFVAPNLDESGTLAVLEAMSAALPVIATDTASHRAVVDDGQQGRLVPTGDASALAAAIVELLCDPQRAQQLGEQARQRARRDFALEDCIDRHVALFREVGLGTRS